MRLCRAAQDVRLARLRRDPKCTIVHEGSGNDAKGLFQHALVAVALSLLFMHPVSADETPPSVLSSPVAGVTDCTDDSVQRMFDEAILFYRRLGNGRVLRIGKDDKEIDRLWKRAPDCSTPEKREDLAHHGFKQYMIALLIEAYEGAILKMRAGQPKAALFYMKCYFSLQNGTHKEAQAEGWTSWLHFESQSLPVMQAMEERLFKAGYY
jgi:hypothetical protein